MACKAINAEIDGRAVFVLQWPATKAMEMQAKLLNTMGGNVLPFIHGDWKFGDLVRLISIADNPQEHVALVKEFISCARLDGAEITPALFDFTYSGDLMLAYKVFAFACEAQFKDFFNLGLEMQEASKAQEAAAKKVASESK